MDGAKLAINKGTVLLGSFLVVVVGTLIVFPTIFLQIKRVIGACCKTIDAVVLILGVSNF
jgi:hypothetical protein